MEIVFVPSKEARKQAAEVGRRSKWNYVIQKVKFAPEGQALKLELPKNLQWGENPDPKARARFYQLTAILRKKAKDMGFEIDIYRSQDGKHMFIERQGDIPSASAEASVTTEVEEADVNLDDEADEDENLALIGSGTKKNRRK